jgi:MscS family membrane protein
VEERVMRIQSIGGIFVGLVLAFGLASPSVAQEGQPAAEAPAAPIGPEDELNRGVPRTSMQGYLVASRDGDYELAAQFLSLRPVPKAERARKGPLLARQLKVVLDRTLWVDLEALSDEPEGNRDDGLSPSRDLVGRIESSRGAADILLQRVKREDGVPIWKIAATTTARIPDRCEEFGYGALGEILPTPFFEVRILEVELWQWICLLLLMAVAYGLSWLAGVAVVRLARPLIERSETRIDDELVRATVGPIRLVLFVVLFSAGTAPLGLSLPVQAALRNLEQAAFLVAITWFLLRVVDLVSDVATQRLTDRGLVPATQFVPLGRKTLKVLLAIFAGLAVLDVFGVNVTAIVAGLGIGGLAIALAAQKTIENLFGGVTLLADRPVAVGDFCRFGDKIGTVEEIGLRSTRVRTLDRTVVTVPNADFSAIQLENFAKRDVIRVHTLIGVRYETTPDQLRYLLAELRSMLLAHPKVSPDPARVRFVGFGAYSLDLEVYAYVLTSDWNEFLTIREDIYLRIMAIVENAGTGFAFPSQTMYLGRDDGLAPERIREAEARVEEWRHANRLPFPDFDSQEKARLRDTLFFPPEGSALSKST